MVNAVRTVRNQHGCTLSELLAVLPILGELSAIALQAIRRFMGKGAAEAANTEAHHANAAIPCCLLKAGVVQLDVAALVDWDGGRNVVTATGAGGSSTMPRIPCTASKTQ